jgi:hypothetical protein
VRDRLGTGDLPFTTQALLTHLSYTHRRGRKASAFGVRHSVFAHLLPDAPALVRQSGTGGVLIYFIGCRRAYRPALLFCGVQTKLWGRLVRPRIVFFLVLMPKFYESEDVRAGSSKNFAFSDISRQGS